MVDDEELSRLSEYLRREDANFRNFCIMGMLVILAGVWVVSLLLDSSSPEAWISSDDYKLYDNGVDEACLVLIKEHYKTSRNSSPPVKEGRNIIYKVDTDGLGPNLKTWVPEWIHEPNYSHKAVCTMGRGGVYLKKLYPIVE